MTSKKHFEINWPLGLTQWNLNSFEFKFDDNRLSSWYKDKIGPTLLHPLVLLRQPTGQRQSNIRMQQKKFLIELILFLNYKEILVSSNLKSKLFRFHCGHPNVYSLLIWKSTFLWWHSFLISFWVNEILRFS